MMENEKKNLLTLCVIGIYKNDIVAGYMRKKLVFT